LDMNRLRGVFVESRLADADADVSLSLKREV
jgi:hypothetical protein